ARRRAAAPRCCWRRRRPGCAGPPATPGSLSPAPRSPSSWAAPAWGSPPGSRRATPGVWVLTAITVGLFGLLHRWTPLAWAPLAVCAVFGLFGTLLDIPQAVLDI